MSRIADRVRLMDVEAKFDNVATTLRELGDLLDTTEAELGTQPAWWAGCRENFDRALDAFDIAHGITKEQEK